MMARLCIAQQEKWNEYYSKYTQQSNYPAFAPWLQQNKYILSFWLPHSKPQGLCKKRLYSDLLIMFQ
jgi:hypothetical protein